MTTRKTTYNIELAGMKIKEFVYFTDARDFVVNNQKHFSKPLKIYEEKITLQRSEITLYEQANKQ